MCKPGLMAYVWNPSTWQADAGGLQAIERLFKNKEKCMDPSCPETCISDYVILVC